MGVWRPQVRVESNRSLELSRGNPLRYVYSLGRGKTFPYSTTAYLTVSNSYGQTLGVFSGVVNGGEISFYEPAEVTDKLPRGATWTLSTEYGGEVTLRVQGIVIRNEAPFPDAPANSTEFEGVQYRYSFANVGPVHDPAWRIMDGTPTVYDNSGRSLPNGVAAGAFYKDVAMLYFAPLKSDAVRLTYNTIRGGANSNGYAWAVVCSNYDMTNWVGFYHKQVWGLGSWDNDRIGIITGTGPTEFSIRAEVEGDTSNNTNYTGVYNPLTDTYSLYKGTSLTPIVTWTDNTGLIDHGEGEQHVGFGFRSDLAAAGIQVSDWIIGDTP
ncbi:LtfC-like domain-containing protein [Mycolicibacterium palauense]|uniref:LtfC-like domain-containing protein n=1 Tax=Mycolicibacterium palauense TaxID=2034511 RepID=UPI00114542E0|nr:hypothetical protein [Mycolicibacterium palauense]